MKTSSFIFFSLLAFTIARAQTVSTLAGSGSQGFTDATGSLASFRGPSGVCIDPTGNIYTLDQGNRAVRKITPGGVVNTIAGNGTSGLVNGTGTLATFGTAFGICADPSGNIFVADMQNFVIRKITPAGLVSTFAGSGQYGSADGTGALASFGYPTGVCSDALGNIYVADDGSFSVRKITPGGVVTTIAGSGSAGFANGTGTLASFNTPTGVYVDISGNIIVADIHNHAIRKIAPNGVVSTIAGNGSAGFANGTGTLATFNAPYSICGDNAGNIYVAEYNNHVIRIITPAGQVSVFAGTGSSGFANGTATLASFSFPTGICADGLGNYYVSDAGNNAVRKISTVNSGTVSTVSAHNIAAINEEIKLYPNPANETLNFKFESLNTSKIKLQMLNALGEIIFKLDEFDITESLDIKSLNNGMYFLNLKFEEKNTIIKFVKE